MPPSPETHLTWRRALRAVSAAWKPLVVYELVMSLVITSVLGPILLAWSYRLIELTGETVIGNLELARFFLSPLGLSALVLGLSVTLGLVLIEYAGLILLADAALRGTTLSLWQVVAGIVGAAPRLWKLAAVQTSIALLASLPFLGLAALAYWLLLSGTDINFYLTERPPRFWLAVAIGIVLAAGLAVVLIWFFLRWALAVPACVLDRQSALAALRTSARLMQTRGRRLLVKVGIWLLAKQAVLIAAIAGLDQINGALLARFEDRLSLLLGSAIAWLVFDTVVLQLLGSAFAIGLAALIAYEYERARPPDAEARTSAAAQAAAPLTGRTRAALVTIMVGLPLASIGYSVLLAREFVEHRPAQVTAHRAGSKAAPENSLAALRLSIEAGADFVEIDAQQTADGHVVLLHDRDLRRVTGDPRVLTDVTLADLKQLRLRDARGWTDETIPTLGEFIDVCDRRMRLNVELKDFGRGQSLPMAVLDVLREHDYTELSIVSSFQLPPLLEMKQAEPKLPIGMIVSAVRGDLTRLPVNFLSLNQRLVRGDLVRRAHQRGLEVHAWTVNDRQSALRLLDLGCDNLLTSDPLLMREVVDWYASLSDAERIVLRLRRWVRE